MSDERDAGPSPAGAPGAGPIELTTQELSSIEQYRKLRQTSVLVILFTDIKGFTSLTERRGDRHALELLQHHDRILVGTIEEGGGGLVVKHIGDSIMAVFSEPSTAVERALAIQERIRTFNAERPDEEPLQVRIGLHMGQVAVENQTQLDLFGRHVNRASRVEGLADAGQIFLTYPVFDSARGWLASGAARTLAWKQHGSYTLKGITEPVAIYEVVDSRFAAPRPPRGGRRKRSLLPVWAAIAVLVAGAAIALGVTQVRRTEVWFEGWATDVDTIVDQGGKLLLAGEPSQVQRKSLVRLSPGRHLLRQDIHWQVKNYMEVDIRRGKNVVTPRFTAAWLPDLEKRLDWEPGTRSVAGREEFTYPLYDAKSLRTDHVASIDLSVSGVENPADRRRLLFTMAWKVVLDGTTISASSHVADIDTTSDGTARGEQVLWEDGAHWWFLRWYAGSRAMDATVGAAYIEYKD
jgi:class 3 adenylate cyclase